MFQEVKELWFGIINEQDELSQCHIIFLKSFAKLMKIESFVNLKINLYLIFSYIQS